MCSLRRGLVEKVVIDGMGKSVIKHIGIRVEKCKDEGRTETEFQGIVRSRPWGWGGAVHGGDGGAGHGGVGELAMGTGWGETAMGVGRGF